jgi:hypothetical protein
MPLTDFQIDILEVLAANRLEESRFAGGVRASCTRSVIHRSLESTGADVAAKLERLRARPRM